MEINAIIHSKYLRILDFLVRIWKLKNIFKNYIVSYVLWLWDIVPYIKGGAQANGIWKTDLEVNIGTQDGLEWEMGKAPQYGT